MSLRSCKSSAAQTGDFGHSHQRRSDDAVQGGLAVKGTLILVGAAESMQISPLFLLSGSRSVKGWYSGTSIDSQDTLAFSAKTGVRSMNEVYPFKRSPKVTSA